MFSVKETLKAMAWCWALSLVMATICYMLPSGAQNSQGHVMPTILEAMTGLMSVATFFAGIIMPIATASSE